MVQVNILANGFIAQNSRGFLFPILFNRRRLAHDYNIQIRVFRRVRQGLDDCDALLIDSKAIDAAWDRDRDPVLAQFSNWARGCRIGYFDLTDSASWLRSKLLPHVDRYFKNQLLIDRRQLRQRLYGYRLYTDFYHRQDGVDDDDPAWSEPIDPVDEEKLSVSWNAGLCNYAIYGPRLSRIYDLIPLPFLLKYPQRFGQPGGPRHKHLSCRGKVHYPRATVTYQRQKTLDKLLQGVVEPRLSKWAYFKELRDTKIVVSPFGWGEINQKDFETFLAGAVLVKPDLDHLETWPQFFEPGATYVPYRWDLADLEANVDDILSNYGRYIDIAREGQNRYAYYTASDDGFASFCDRFVDIVTTILASQRGPRAEVSEARKLGDY